MPRAIHNKEISSVMDNFLILLQKTFVDSGIVKFIGAALLAFLVDLNMFFLPIAGFLKLTAVLVTADFLTGVIASLMKGEEFTSSGIKKTVFKITGYSIALIAAHYVTLILLPNIQAAYFATFYIASTEVKSLDENMEKIFGVSVLGFLNSKLGDVKKENKKEK